MFDANLYTLQNVLDQAPGAVKDVQHTNAATARHLYSAARVHGQARRLWARLTRRPAGLLDLATCVPRGFHGDGHEAGVRAVSLAQIRGSENRTADFDARFNPLQGHSEQRWLSVASARLSGVPLPPVELIQVGDVYFVRDGHHRISVARAMGETDIDAEVRVWGLPAALAANEVCVLRDPVPQMV